MVTSRWVGNTIIHQKLFPHQENHCTVWTVNAVKRVWIDSKQKRVWIDKDVIDSQHCMYIHYSCMSIIFSKTMGNFSWYLSQNLCIENKHELETPLCQVRIMKRCEKQLKEKAHRI